MYPTDFDNPQFLEPPHSHDPILVSHIAIPPTSLVKDIPASFQAALKAIQESTSITFASYTRLRDLIGVRFQHLIPAKTQPASKANELYPIKYSEPAFFNYTNQFQAEKRYLLEEALPDWRHKAARLNYENRQLNAIVVLRHNAGTMTDFEIWWSALKTEVDEWLETAEDADTPGFDETVAEYQAFQAKEIRRTLARYERKSRKIMLQLDIPEAKKQEQVDKIDSGISMGIGSGCVEYEFAT